MNGSDRNRIERLQPTHELGDGDAQLKDTAFHVEEVARRVSAALPLVKVDHRQFCRWLLDVVEQSHCSGDSITGLNLEDLFLAYACSQGDAVALGIFERECVGELRAVAAKLRLSESDCDDVRQKLWHKLFTNAPQRRMRILDYRGAGLLRHWFRVLATRCVLDELRESKRRRNRHLHSNEAELSLRVAEADPELASVRRQYQVAFRAAFRAAVERLMPEERNILKCQYLMGMSTEQIGRAFGIHKATAARYLVRTREKLLRDTRELVKSSLRANTDELSSVMRLFDEGLSTSLSGLLQ